jgi:outer membrane biosynthesis protein TonB
VEPEMPDQARKAKIKVIIEVQFIVNEKGQVEEASISQIKLFEDNKDQYTVVDHIGYGLTRATLSAALQWKFRPAVKNGKKVPAYSKHSFTYGF